VFVAAIEQLGYRRQFVGRPVRHLASALTCSQSRRVLRSICIVTPVFRVSERETVTRGPLTLRRELRRGLSGEVLGQGPVWARRA
jgi:hypothetical protein